MDCYCAICGGPSFEPTLDPVADMDVFGEARYWVGQISGPEDPELGWLARVVIIFENLSQISGSTLLSQASQTSALPQLPALANGQVNSTEAGGIGWVESNGSPHYTWTIDLNSDMWRVPFHLECLEILCRYMDIPMSQLNNTSFLEVLKAMEEFNEGHRFLDIDYGDIDTARWDTWKSNSGEYFLSNPVNVARLTELYRNPPRYDDSIAHEKKMIRVEGDPFRKFSQEIILLIMSELDVPTIFKMRQSSPAFSNTGLGMSFWKSHIVGDMPWLWDFPASALVQVEGVDWEQLYRTLYRGSRYKAPNGIQIYGLCNRRRIWEQMCHVFAVPYREIESRRSINVSETTQNQAHDEA